jgi:hypothetical protein
MPAKVEKVDKSQKVDKNEKIDKTQKVEGVEGVDGNETVETIGSVTKNKVAKTLKAGKNKKVDKETTENQTNNDQYEQQTVTPETIEKNDDKKVFTVLSIKRDGNEENFKGGKFLNRTPGGAARKAVTQACRVLYGTETTCTVDITIKDITKNNTSKEYSYRATRTLNKKDVDFKNNSGEKVKIPFKYSTELKSLRKDVAGNVTEEVVADTSTV